MKSKWIKGLATVCGAIFFSTLGIFAADSMQGIRGTFMNVANVGKSTDVCAVGMVPVKSGDYMLCVDQYEASPSEQCVHKVLMNALQSEENTNTPECYAQSAKDVVPWNYISLPQAQRMCAGAGKRLPTSKEWFDIALGTTPEGCTVLSKNVGETGNETCVSRAGAYDAVGNVWEWVDESVVNSSFDGRILPLEGYITSVDANGVAITSNSNPDPVYGNDYFWSKPEGVFGMIRGGFYASGDDSGLYAVNASVPTSFVTQGVGFRCVEDLI